LNREVVRKKDWETTKVSEGDKIEVIHFVGGG
jgi:thiamine biosynthesis protein ThiS